MTPRERKARVPVRDPELLERALTHRSFANDAVDASNERMEFLGDSILGMIIAQHLYETYPDWDQGQLSKAKASVVMEGSVAEAGRRLGFDQTVRLGPGEEASGGRARPSIVGDVFEAVVAAVYLSNGMQSARAFVLRELSPELERVARGEFADDDFKSRLQEDIQARFRTTPLYRVISETGPAHSRTYVVEVRIADEAFGRGSGRSKKEAEQAAAKQALARIAE